MKRNDFILIITLAIIAFMAVSCNEKDNSIYSVPDSNVIVVPCGNGITIIAEDETRDENGNCKSSPYTKFYEEWESKEPWTDGFERVYDAWITMDKEYFVQTIKCVNAEKHRYQVVNHQMADRETFIKYFDTDKGYGGRKGMIFTD